MIPLFDKTVIPILTAVIELRLEEGLHKGKLIDVGNYKIIGKIPALINFSKKYNIPIFVPSNFLWQVYKDAGAEVYHSLEFMSNRKIKNLLVEEGVDCQMLSRAGYRVITGFYNSKIPIAPISNYNTEEVAS